VHLCVYVCISVCMCVYVCVCACTRVYQKIQSMQLILTSAAFSTGIFIIFCSLPDASTPSPSPLPSSHSMKRAGLTPVCACLRLCACVRALAYACARACARFNCTEKQFVLSLNFHRPSFLCFLYMEVAPPLPPPTNTHTPGQLIRIMATKSSSSSPLTS